MATVLGPGGSRRARQQAAGYRVRSPDRVYNNSFFAAQEVGSQSSAAEVVPIIAAAIAPGSVIDVGCGVGHWPRAFAEHGATMVHGIDGGWARNSGQRLSEHEFVEFDFAKEAMPFRPATPLPRYDLVTSFEFGEHIGDDRAEALVDLLCSLSDAVVMSAAVPGQRGIHHVNERWPGYWAEKFARRGYVACDFIRPAIWHNDRVAWWYVQNSIAYFRGEPPEAVQRMAEENWRVALSRPLPLVHPRAWALARRPFLQKVRSRLSKWAKRMPGFA